MARMRRSTAAVVPAVDIIRDIPGRWYRPETVADALGVPLNALADGIQSGDCYAVKFGGPAGWRVQIEEVQRWLLTVKAAT